MNNRILETVKKYNMLSYGDTIVAGVSGGADSMLLLHFLISVRDLYNLNIIVAHIEHGIRGEESLADAQFVKAYCEKNNVEFRQLSINAPLEAAQEHLSVEEYSRQARYRFFTSIKCDKIATAHNMTDNAETLIFRLARGTGLKGACAILPVRENIIRPLIEIGADEIRDYCDNNDIPYRVDKTNFSNDYSRNLIRNKILPLLNQINSESVKNIDCFIKDAVEDFSFIDECAQKAYSESVFEDKIEISKIKHFNTAIIKRVIKKYFSDKDILLDRIHLNNILSLLNKQGKVQIKGELFAVSDGEYLRYADFSNDKREIKYEIKILKFSEFNPKNVDFYCDCDKIIGNAEIRCRMVGDTIRPAGRSCTKSLKKLFNELKIPQEERNSVGVVCDDIGVIGVIGYCADERVRLDSSTKNVFSIKLPLED